MTRARDLMFVSMALGFIVSALFGWTALSMGPWASWAKWVFSAGLLMLFLPAMLLVWAAAR